MTPRQILTLLQYIIADSGTTVTTSNRGHGSVKLATKDSHAAHAIQHHAIRAGLKVAHSLTDDGLYVVRLTGFRFVPSGPLHTCSTPGSVGPCAACGGVR
jgi:hypothetical protein